MLGYSGSVFLLLMSWLLCVSSNDENDSLLNFSPENVALVGLGILFFVLFVVVIVILFLTGTRKCNFR